MIKNSFETWKVEILEVEEEEATTAIRQSSENSMILGKKNNLKSLIRILNHIFQMKLYKAWTLWNLPEFEEYEEVIIETKTKLLDRKFQTFEILNKPYRDLEVFYENQFDEKSEVETLETSQQIELNKIIEHFNSIQQKRENFKQKMIIKWLEQSNMKYLQKNALSRIVQFFRLKEKRMKDAFNLFCAATRHD